MKMIMSQTTLNLKDPKNRLNFIKRDLILYYFFLDSSAPEESNGMQTNDRWFCTWGLCWPAGSPVWCC